MFEQNSGVSWLVHDLEINWNSAKKRDERLEHQRPVCVFGSAHLCLGLQSFVVFFALFNSFQDVLCPLPKLIFRLCRLVDLMVVNCSNGVFQVSPRLEAKQGTSKLGWPPGNMVLFVNVIILCFPYPK